MDDAAPCPRADAGRRHAVRTALACTECRSRKVRCIIDRDDRPCVNCTKDGIDCIFISKRRGICRSIRRSNPVPEIKYRPSYIVSHSPLGADEPRPRTCPPLPPSRHWPNGSATPAPSHGPRKEYLRQLAACLEAVDFATQEPLKSLHASLLQSMIHSVEQSLEPAGGRPTPGQDEGGRDCPLPAIPGLKSVSVIPDLPTPGSSWGWSQASISVPFLESDVEDESEDESRDRDRSWSNGTRQHVDEECSPPIDLNAHIDKDIVRQRSLLIGFANSQAVVSPQMSSGLSAMACNLSPVDAP